MSSPAGGADRVSYVAFQRMALRQPEDERWELVGGSFRSMPRGETAAHNEIVGNIRSALVTALRGAGSRCRVYSSSVRVDDEPGSLSVLPDIVVRCGPRLPGQDRIVDPVAIVEVLAPEADEKDRYDKAEAYFRIPTVGSYWLVSQNAMDVTVLTRGEADWVRRRYYEPEDRVAAADLGFEVSLAEIYAGVVEITG